MEPMKRYSHQGGHGPYVDDNGETKFEWHCNCGCSSTGWDSNKIASQQFFGHQAEWIAYYEMLDAQQVVPPELQCGYCGKEIEKGIGKAPVVMSFHDDKEYHMNCYQRRWPNA